MNYPETVEWLFNQLPMYQRIGLAAYKANLDNTIALDNYLGNPHKHFKSIHVAGTNGKGSVCHMLASILHEAGYKVGLYTSPHLKDYRERIRLNGALIPEQYVQNFVTKNKPFFEANSLSFFEMTVGLAFDYFAHEKVDIAVIETGLGGRLDSTNIIVPLVSVITTIDKDHTGILGNTLSKIASEKAGIIKDHIPVIIGEKRGFLRSRFRESALRKNAPLHVVDHRRKTKSSDLTGMYQKDNVRVVLKTMEILQKQNHFKITPAQMESGLLNVVKNTGLRGRYETLQLNPKIIAETAHNPAGIKVLVKSLKQESFNNLRIVLGVSADKDLSTILHLLPVNAQYYIAKPNLPRGMEVTQLAAEMKKLNFNFRSFNSVSEALENCKSDTYANDLIVVCGSIFTVAEII